MGTLFSIPLADVTVTVEGIAFTVRAAVSETLPVSALLGTDVPELGQLLTTNSLKYPEAVPLRSIDAETIAEEFMVIFSRVGIPQEILTDQGSNFQSQLLRELYRLPHIDGLRTSLYHPQTDGLVERFNQTLKNMLRKAASQDGKDWDCLIPFLLFAYREVPHECTEFSPFELLYGRDVCGPLTFSKNHGVVRNEVTPMSLLTMRDRMEHMVAEARENSETAKIQQKTWYDKGARERSFQNGDQVLVLLPTSPSKLTAHWQDPYTVEEKIGKVNYKLRMSDRRKKTAIFHVNMLQKRHTYTDSIWIPCHGGD